MSTVGPRTNTNSASRPASTMLMFDSHWMPRAMPDTADRTNAAVSTMIIGTRTLLPTRGDQPGRLEPATDLQGAESQGRRRTEDVAKMAMMSMTLPSQPSAARCPMSGTKAELMSWLRPLRKVEYAMARPTTA